MDAYKYEIKDFPLDNESLLLQETLFHNANGYIGVRGSFEEGYPQGYQSIRGQYINGFYNFIKMPQAEKLCGLAEEKQTMLNVADTQGIQVFAGTEKVSVFGDSGNSVRLLDMRRGVTERAFDYRAPGCEGILSVKVTRMASFSVLPLLLTRYEVCSRGYAGELSFVSAHEGEVMNYCNPEDPRVAGESEKHLIVTDTAVQEGASYITAKTSASGLYVTSAVKNILSKDAERSWREELGRVTERLTTVMASGERVVLYKYAVFCDSTRYPDTRESAAVILRESTGIAAAELYEKQEEYLKDFWEKSDIEVEGDEELNAALHYNLYQLIQSVAKDDRGNIAAKGLSGEGYEGHFFWDTEMYLQPFFTLTASEVSKNLIRYRYRTLDAAKENAGILGHKQGAAFPWRTIMGKECSGYFPSGSAQYHISGDIAYSIIAYYLATGDLDLMEECGCEILIETARLWMDLGNYCDGKFRINEVTGPDEYTCMVNNNYYTNAIAKYNLYWAVKMYGLLRHSGREAKVQINTGITEEEFQTFSEASEKMYLPYDERTGINPQDDSFLQKKRWDIRTIREEEKPLLLHYHPMYLYRHQVCKQADTVLAHFILEDLQDLETIRNSFLYYEKVTTHDSSLSTCIFSIVASRLGMGEKAYSYFGESAKLDLFNTHKNTRDGIHTANMGGTYMAVVYGFGGLHLKEDGLYLSPVLPDQWDSYRFRLCYRGARLRVSVERGTGTIELLEGNPVSVFLYGEERELKDRIFFAVHAQEEAV